MLEVLGICFLVVIGAYAYGAGKAFVTAMLKELRQANDAKAPKKQPAQQETRGKIHFKMHGITNPVIVETFFRNFDQGVTETSHCPDFYDGSVEVTFEITRCKFSEALRKDLEEANFVVGEDR